jgi:hypothetical protein
MPALRSPPGLCADDKIREAVAIAVPSRDAKLTDAAEPGAWREPRNRSLERSITSGNWFIWSMLQNLWQIMFPGQFPIGYLHSELKY